MPNVLLLLTDDQRHDTIAALGNDWIRTPHIDRLVARGTAFTRCHIMGGCCGAICMPSRAMLHTGRDLFGLDGDGRTIPAEHTLLGEHLRAHGFASFGTGKWHNSPAAFNRSFAAGDRIFFGGMADHWDVPWQRYDPSGAYGRETAVGSHGGHSTTVCAGQAVRFLRDHDGSQPFFLSVAFLAPHDPRTMPEEFLAPYRENPPPLPDNLLPEHPFDNGELLVRDELLADFPREPEQVRRHLAEYGGMISHLDHAIGRILAVLDEQGLAEDTIVVLAGDNGLALGQHGLFGKQNLYDHSLRVPLVLAGPGVPAGERRAQLCHLHDVMPTVCELLGIGIPDSVQARSLAPVLSDAGRMHREAVFGAYRHCQRSVSDGAYKYIEYAVDGRHRRQLFDLQADPGEGHDLSEHPDQAERLAACAARLETWREQLADDRPEHGRRFWAVARPG